MEPTLKNIKKIEIKLFPHPYTGERMKNNKKYKTK